VCGNEKGGKNREGETIKTIEWIERKHNWNRLARENEEKIPTRP
jgi:hypothetical protein